VNFDTVFDRQKTRTVTRSLGTRILRFSCYTKLTKTVQKLSKYSRSDQRGGGRSHHRPPPLNTPLTDYRSILYRINSAAYAELSVFFRLISLSGHMGQLRGFSSAFLLVINRLSATWRHYTIVLVSFSELMKLSIFSASEK